MPKPTQVTVTITGPQGSGKTRLANLILDALLNTGAAIETTADGETAVFAGSRVVIVEVQL